MILRSVCDHFCGRWGDLNQFHLVPGQLRKDFWRRGCYQWGKGIPDTENDLDKDTKARRCELGMSRSVPLKTVIMNVEIV